MQVITSLHTCIHVCTKQKNVLKRGLLGYVLRQSWAVFCRNLRICDLRISHENFLILDSGMSPRICGFTDCKKRFLPNLCWLAAWDLVTLANNWVHFWDNWLLKQKKSPNLQWRQMLIILLHIEFMPICLKKSLCPLSPFSVNLPVTPPRLYQVTYFMYAIKSLQPGNKFNNL